MGIAIIFWVVFCILVGTYASKKGRSGFGYFILSVIISPLISFVILLMIGETQESKAKKVKEKMEIQNEVSKNLNAQSKENDDNVDKSDKIEKLGHLLDKGLITKDEFEKEKKEILNS